MASRSIGRLDDELGIAQLGPGYVVRRDGHAIGIIEIIPPDPRVHDSAALLRIIREYEGVLMALHVRTFWYTIALPPDVRPVVATLRQAQQQAPDLTSYLIIGALADDLQHTLLSAADRTVRWVMALSTEPPEEPPHGLLDDLNPYPPPTRPPKDPGSAAIEGLLQRALGMLRLFGEHSVRVPTIAETRALLALMLDPVAWETTRFQLEPDAVRLLQGGGWQPDPIAPASPAAQPTSSHQPAAASPPWQATATARPRASMP